MRRSCWRREETAFGLGSRLIDSLETLPGLDSLEPILILRFSTGNFKGLSLMKYSTSLRLSSTHPCVLSREKEGLLKRQIFRHDFLQERSTLDLFQRCHYALLCSVSLQIDLLTRLSFDDQVSLET